jgi:hypothetical protein
MGTCTYNAQGWVDMVVSMGDSSSWDKVMAQFDKLGVASYHAAERLAVSFLVEGDKDGRAPVVAFQNLGS